MAQGLKAADNDGLSDPVFIARCNGAVARAKELSKTLNPEWFETLSLPVSLPLDTSLCPDLHCLVYDKDFGGILQLLGRFSIPVLDILRYNVKDDAKLNPRWYDLLDADRNLSEGRVLVATQLIEPHLVADFPNLRPKKFTPMFLEISTLGLRGLKGTFIKKPHVEFRLQDSKAFKTKGSSVPTATNPNILQVLKIPVNIPDDPRFAPVLSIIAVDEWFGGSISQNLGNAALYLGDYHKKYLKHLRELEHDEKGDEKDELLPSGRSPSERPPSPSLSSPAPSPSPAASPVRDPVVVGSSSEVSEEKLQPPTEQKIEDADDDEDEPEEQEDVVKTPTPEDLEKVHIVRWGEKVKGTAEAARFPFLKGRRILDCELEDEKRGGMNLKPFEEFSLKVGKKGGKGRNEERRVGKLKGVCHLVPPGQSSTSEFLKELMSPTEVFVRLYVLQGKQLTPMDEGGTSDPYLVVSLGRQKINLRKNHLDNTINPDFYETFEFPCQIPGVSELTISVWDWDGIGDDLIGSTVIDVEDRWFTPAWRALKKKPVESRTLRNPTSTLSQGGGTSDPYLVVSLGRQKINLRKNHLDNTINPDFYETFEFPCQIPGVSELTISVWDWDGIGDDLIGSTVIDVEDRWFTPAWRALKKKPVESRTLRNPTSTLSQGKLTLWVDIMTPQDAKKNKLINIKPPAPVEYELRVIIWKTEDVTIKDEITEQNDLYLTGTFDVPKLQQRQRTDTHLRSKAGKGSFNWRMIFPVEVPLMDPRFKVQIWDMDFFSANDSICEASISLRSLFNKAIATKGGHTKLVGPDGEEKIWIDQLFHPNFPGKSQGKVQLSLELMPRLKCVEFPAGLGRDEPNQNPFLPPPEGRLQFNILKPWAFFRDILGDKIYAKCCCIIFCGLFIAAIATFAPTLLSTIVAKIVT
eukprot:TRINITY_DN5614_c0_g1_i4.p1 TRINITY_DN5614_c0_g1~~TRINITY_DN5614_c0_g1_i4.p1  ORF type:complete len:991 (+),score=303.70 TRINITY_DN5614_c0_g1_i4:225-2975(+)